MESSDQRNKDIGPISREARFVSHLIERCKTDKGLAARLRRADNPATEYQSWEFLASMSIDLEKDYVRIPYSTIAAAVARAKINSNGTMSLGQALAKCYEDGVESNQAKARLRRLLACDTVPELCRNLRPLFALMVSKSIVQVNFERILRQLNSFSFNSERIKAQWAQEFYARIKTEEGAS